jgi:hypothetical protein
MASPGVTKAAAAVAYRAPGESPPVGFDQKTWTATRAMAEARAATIADRCGPRDDRNVHWPAITG